MYFCPARSQKDVKIRHYQRRPLYHQDFTICQKSFEGKCFNKYAQSFTYACPSQVSLRILPLFFLGNFGVKKKLSLRATQQFKCTYSNPLWNNISAKENITFYFVFLIVFLQTICFYYRPPLTISQVRWVNASKFFILKCINYVSNRNWKLHSPNLWELFQLFAKSAD
jgi:hypothetical protein